MRQILVYSPAILLIVAFVTLSCNEAWKQKPLSKKTETSPGQPEITIHLSTFLASHKQAPSIVRVKYDHFFKTAKEYNGFSINSLLDSIIKIKNFDTTDGMLVFKCSDGYKPVMELSKMYGQTKGYIAFKDVDSSIPGNWPDSIKDKFNPYYLVWDDVEKNDKSFAWPYGLVSITLTSLKLVFKDAYPNNPSFKNGFALFRTHCMKCHSINKVGGSMGPEFNVPKNITEYWRDKDIVAFAKNPNAYRRGSTMPAISTITNSDYKEIVAYIRYMKEFKID